MVMDGVPSAQCVGREFVKQYYMMLNQAPQFLHRFYSHNSSFVHARMDLPGDKPTEIIGQAEIYKKIASLNFRDCRAKIRQVDSQATVSEGVLIQVIGELSNDGGPLRSFVQTFLLVAQSPKKYYVHNDIFRYLDEVLVDDVKANSVTDIGSDICNDVESNGEGKKNEDHADVEMKLEGGAWRPSDGVTDGHVSSGAAVIEGMNTTATYYVQQEPALSNGSVDHAPENSEVFVGQSLIISSADAVDPSREVTAAAAACEISDKASESTSGSGELPLKETDAATGRPKEPIGDQHQTAAPEQQDRTTNVEPPAETEPKVVKPMTWAALAGKTPPASTAATAGAQSRSSSSATPAVRATKPQAAHQTRPATEARSETNQSAHSAAPPKYPRNSAAAQSDRMTVSQDSTELDTSSRASNDGDDQRRATTLQQNYPDSQQIFVGNLPQFLSDKDIREFFSQYGEVVEMKINRKNGSINNLPFFGFIVFDSAETTQKVLANRPMFMTCANGRHRINVEEKKPRAELVAARPRSAPRGGMRQSYGRGRPSYGNSSANPGSNATNTDTETAQNAIAEDSQSAAVQ